MMTHSITKEIYNYAFLFGREFEADFTEISHIKKGILLGDAHIQMSTKIESGLNSNALKYTCKKIQ